MVGEGLWAVTCCLSKAHGLGDRGTRWKLCWEASLFLKSSEAFCLGRHYGERGEARCGPPWGDFCPPCPGHIGRSGRSSSVTPSSPASQKAFETGGEKNRLFRWPQQWLDREEIFVGNSNWQLFIFHSFIIGSSVGVFFFVLFMDIVNGSCHAPPEAGGCRRQPWPRSWATCPVNSHGTDMMECFFKYHYVSHTCIFTSI